MEARPALALVLVILACTPTCSSVTQPNNEARAFADSMLKAALIDGDETRVLHNSSASAKPAISASLHQTILNFHDSCGRPAVLKLERGFQRRNFYRCRLKWSEADFFSVRVPCGQGSASIVVTVSDDGSGWKLGGLDYSRD